MTFREGANTKRLLRSDCEGGSCASNAGTGLGHMISTADRKSFQSFTLFTGSAEVKESPEQSAVLAVLDATNRWVEYSKG